MLYVINAILKYLYFLRCYRIIKFLKSIIKLFIIFINGLATLCGLLTIISTDYSSEVYSNFLKSIMYLLPYLSMTLFSAIMIVLLFSKSINKILLLCFINISLLIIMLETVNSINMLSVFSIPVLTCPFYVIYIFLENLNIENN